MAGKKGWGKKPPKDPQPEPVEVPASDGLEQVPQPETGGDSVVPHESSRPDLAAQIERDMTPSCMNGCPHYFPTPEVGGKYMGLCRRYPPIPSGNAKFYTWPIVINHPVRGFPQYPICGEHPIFQKERGRGMSLGINHDLAAQ